MRRLLHLTLAWLGLVAVAACAPSGLPGVGSPPARDVAAQPGDLPAGLQPCAGSGDIATWLDHTRTARSDEYEPTAQAWKDLQAAGATDAALQSYADSRPACGGLFAARSAGAAGRLLVSFVVRFHDEAAAGRVYRRGLYGALQPDQVRGTAGVSEGDATGLGPNSVAIAPAGGRIYLAAFQRSAYYCVLTAIGLDPPAARSVAEKVAARVH